MLRLVAALPCALLLSSLGCSDAGQEGATGSSENDLAGININWSARGTISPISPVAPAAPACEQEAQLPEDGPVCGVIDTEPPSPFNIPDDDDYDGIPYVDPSRELKDLSTDFVTGVIFGTPETLYSFLEEVYGKLDAQLAQYRQSHSLPDRSIFLLFKGGNVLRSVAQTYFQLLHPAYRDLLKNEYGGYFKRSDSDFSIYIDPGLANYDQVLEEVTELTFAELNNIRNDFFANPERYFDFLRFKKDYASGQIMPLLASAQKNKAKDDPNNETWYGSNILQVELLNAFGTTAPACRYHGQFDYQYLRDPNTNAINAIPKSTTRNWIYNSNNQTLTWAWGSDPNHLISFHLVRSKVAFEYVYDRGGKRENTIVGGELIDVSIPTRQDSSLQHFFEHYEDNVHDYTLVSADRTQRQTIKAYSIPYLADDLETILFSQFARPWGSGPKYGKRTYRVFLLHIMDLLNRSEDAREKFLYLSEAQNFVDKIKTFYANGSPSQDVIDEARDILVSDMLSGDLPDFQMNNFWGKTIDLMQRMLDSPLNGDAEGFNDFVNNYIEDNLNNANIQYIDGAGEPKVDLEAIYTVSMSQLF